MVHQEGVWLTFFLCTGHCYAWNGASYWNDRYSAQGINYPTTNTFWGIWSESTIGHYFLPSSSYGSYESCSCSCDRSRRIVTGCSGSVLLRNSVFDNLTIDSFSSPSNVTSITIINVPSFVLFEKGLFDSMTSLSVLIVTRTGLTTFPDISATAMTRMMLGDNSIQFFNHNYAKINWPSTLTELSLIQNKIKSIPDEYFTGSNIQYLGLSRNQLRYVPWSALKDVKSLLFLGVDGNVIEKVSKRHLSYLATSQLQHLNLSNNAISYIQPTALEQLGQLKILELHNNELTKLTKGVFANMPNLLHLDLVQNKLTILREDSITNLPALMSLRLHSQQGGLANIHYNAFKNINKSLTNLWVSDNSLTSFPHVVLSEQRYDRLTEVHADHNGITNITEYSTDAFSPLAITLFEQKKNSFKVWSTTPNIQYLYLQYNSIPEILSYDLCGLVSLRYLRLEHNLLTNEKFADDVLSCLSFLYYIDLSFNQFHNVPKTFRSANMTSLTNIVLSYNYITFLETGTFTAIPLVNIYLKSNSIVVIENGVFPQTISSIDISYNCFRFTHDNPFANLTRLSRLNLRNNRIHVIPDTAFRNCTALTSLTLDNNNLGWLTKTVFQDCPLTSGLSVTNNDIAYIEDGIFAHLSRTSYLYLYNNKLTKFPNGGAFSSLSVSYLYLSNNRFTEVTAGVFNDIYIGSSLDLSGTSISTIETGAFRSVTVRGSLSLTRNPLRTIREKAFVSVNCYYVYLNGMYITHVPRGAFQYVTATDIRLDSNSISYIDIAAFDGIRLYDDLLLSRNQLTTLNGNIFANNSIIGGYLDLSGNSLSFISSQAFNGLSSVKGILLSKNRLTTLDGNIFANTSIFGGYLDLSENSLSFISSQAFNGHFSVKRILLNKNQLKEYPSHALSGKGLQTIDISDNSITYLSLCAFLGQTGLKTINLRNNQISSILKGTFDPLINLESLDLSNNIIGYIEPGSFSNLLALKTMTLARNQIYFFPTVPRMSQLEYIDLSNNKLQTFEIGAFDKLEGSQEFRTLAVKCTSNENLTFKKGWCVCQAHMNEIFKKTLTGNNEIGCDCYMYQTLEKIQDTIVGGFCGSPTQVVGVSFDFSQMREQSYFLQRDINDFFCSPLNVIASALTSSAVTVTWTRPNNTVASTAYISDEDAASWQYLVTCLASSTGTNHTYTMTDSSTGTNHTYNMTDSSTGTNHTYNITDSSTGTNHTYTMTDSSTGTNHTYNMTDSSTGTNHTYNMTDESNSTFTSEMNHTFTSEFNHTFTADDGIQADTEYVCVVALIESGLVSAPSQPAVTRTQMKTENQENFTSVSTSDFVLPIVYYDFSTSHTDFTGYESTIINQPSYVPSPYGGWLMRSSTPITDTFSVWFVEKQGTNIAITSNITLTLVGTSPSKHRYVTQSFFPVDGLGFGNTGKNCLGEEHNMGFTSAIRSGFVYQGTEAIAVGGGDDMWVYLNGVLVLEVITRYQGSTIPCKKIDISAASVTGGAILTPQSGYVVSNQCVLTESKIGENVTLELEVGERYHFSVFHTERLLCTSTLFIETESFLFIEEQSDEPPGDYVVSFDEDFHVDGVVQEVVLSDVFSAGPTFDVTITRGNEARHFSMKNYSTSNRVAAVAPSVTPPTFTTVNGISFVECSSPSSITPEGYDTSAESFTINTDIALFTLASAFDYEANSSYTVVVQVVDTGKTPPSTGTITIKIKVTDVNDNCPELPQNSFTLYGEPSLQLSPLARMNASDIDSDANADIVFYMSSVIADPEINWNDTSELLHEVYAANTTLHFSVIAVDNGGYPTRGVQANLTIEIDNSCLVDVEYGLITYYLRVDNATGEVFFRVPGYYYSEHECLDALGIESGVIVDSQLSASSSASLTSAERGRLNIGLEHQNRFSLRGGWVAAINDINQWIQVALNGTHRVRQVQLQGQKEEDNWVTSFIVAYSSDGVTWTNYTNSSGISVFTGNSDRSKIVIVDLDPLIETTYIRINPQTWNNNIAVRFEIKGCSSQKYKYHRTTCERCLPTYYCVGDGTSLPCGRCNPPQTNTTCGRSPTEHSFGLASECLPCPLGWLCSDGYATPCPDYHYATCTDVDCPTSCTLCGTGYACRGGQRYECDIGTYSNGTAEFCQLCQPGTYQNQKGQGSCNPCPAGFTSSAMKDRCGVCPRNTYSDGEGSTCQPCSSTLECPCLDGSPCHSDNLCYNKKTGPSTYSSDCLNCPPGYTGDGVKCFDVNECALYNPCWNNSACLNTEPGYQCRACPHGYTGTYEDALAIDIHRRTFEVYNTVWTTDNQTCFDIDECLVNNGGCKTNTYCYNTIGSYYCGLCKPGYVGDSLTGCKLADYCLSGEHKCHTNAECFYTGSAEYRCECKPGYAGNGHFCGVDSDFDGNPDVAQSCNSRKCKKDNCINKPNSGQEDTDGDSMGDFCDFDPDNDNVYPDTVDNCPYVSNRDQIDTDGDGRGDICDNCIHDVNYDQVDVDGDGIGDVCDSDIDGDGLLNGADNCLYVPNTGQTDSDADGVGDDCDNCYLMSNAAQTDTNENGVGDICDGQDIDGDGVVDFKDNCVNVPNGQQTDSDDDGIGDFCDNDIDGDGVGNSDDNCVYVANPTQTDIDGNHRGDACESDLDLDGTIDTEDNCPKNKDIAVTSFSDHVSLDLNPSWTTENGPVWSLQDTGKDIWQMSTTLKPVALIGEKYFDHVTFSGTTYVDTDDVYGFIGFVFGYQSNKKYYLVTWRRIHFNMGFKGGIKGLQLWLIDSSSAPGTTYAEALYHGCDTAGISTLLWQDSDLYGWECATSYQWIITHISSMGLLRVLVEQGETTIADSGYVYDTSILGGRLGVFTYNQTGSVWSNLHYRCIDRLNYALEFNGSSYGVIGNLSDLSIVKSFTIEAWVYLPSGYPFRKLPVLCTWDRELCLYIENGTFHTQIESKIVDGLTTISTDIWTHIATRYNAQHGTLTMFVNGADGGVRNDVVDTTLSEISWNSSLILFMGRDKENYFEGKIDEVRIYDIAIPNAEIDLYWQKTGMDLEYKKHTVSAHYTMDNNTEISILMDQGPLENDVTLYGSPAFVESTTDYYRYYHTNN